LDLENKRILVTGGTGSLGQSLIRRLLTGEIGTPAKVVVFSRDETKQYAMRAEWKQNAYATDDIAYRNFEGLLQFRIGDIRDYPTVLEAVKGVDVVFNAAALKQVPTCEYFPYEAVQTNIIGAHNITRAIREGQTPVKLAIGVSTDKACKPINVMGMTKALQERIFIESNLNMPETSFVCVRYGNVLASRGSVLPLFQEQIRTGGPVTITLKEMTRFLLTLNQAVDTIFAAVRGARMGETWVPKVPAARILDVAKVLIGDKGIPIKFSGVRPGEKVHEILVSEDEVPRTTERDGYYIIHPIIPELSSKITKPALQKEFSSDQVLMNTASLTQLLLDAAPKLGH
jgi:FlaA1/EpsC-like NDP-sugar epimerase